MAVKQVRVQINGTWTDLTLNTGTGKYEGTVAAPNTSSYNVNANHYYPVVVEATDEAGNVTTKNDTDATLGASLKLTVKEKTAPTIAITSPTASAFLATATPAIIFQLRDEANGSGIDLSRLTLQIDSLAAVNQSAAGMVKETVANGYNFTYTPQVGLSDGSHTVKINVKDFDGNSAVQATVAFTTDTVAPTLEITTPSTNNIFVNNATYNLTGKTSDTTSGVASVKIKLNGSDQGAITVDGSGNFTKSLTLINGANTIEVTATDKAGKTTVITRTINLDTTAPVITAIVITPNPVDAGQTLSISVTVTD